MACEYNSIVNNIENMLSKLSANQKERDDVKPLIKWLNEAKYLTSASIATKEDSVIINNNNVTSKKIKTTIVPYNEGVDIVSNIPVEVFYTKTKEVDKEYKAIINTVISSIKPIGGDKLNHKDSLSIKAAYVFKNSKDNKLIELLKNVFNKDSVVISQLEKMNGYKYREEKLTIDNWEGLSKNYFQSVVALNDSKDKLMDYLKNKYNIEYTKHHVETENIKTGITNNFYYEYTINNYYINTLVTKGITNPKKEKSAGQSKQLNPKFKGKFILAHAGIGKSYAVQYNSNLIDGDDLFTEAANEVVTKYNKSLNEDVQTIPDVSKMKSIFTAWGEYSTDTKKVQEAKKRREEVYQLYADKAQQLMKQGKTILSSSARPATIKIANYVIVQDNTELIKTNLQSDLRINKNSETDTNKIKEKINKFNQVAIDNKIPLIKLSSQEFLSDILYSKDTTKSKPKDEAYVKQDKQQEISTENKLKQLLEVYSTGLAPKIGGGLVEDVTWWETRDEDKPKATMMKGTQEESLKDMLPKIDGKKLNKYKTAVNAWYNENKRGSAIRETLNEILDILNSVEQEPRLAEEFGWDTVATKQEDSIIFANDIIKAAKECAKG